MQRPYSLVSAFSLMDSVLPTLVTLHLSTGRHAFSVSCCPWHQSNTHRQHTFSHNNWSTGTANQPNPTWKGQTHTPATAAHFLPCLPPCVSRPRPDVLLDSGSSVLHGQLLNCRRPALCSELYSKMAGVMTPETLYSHTELLWCPWGLSPTVTLSILVLSFWIYVYYCDHHCCL